MPSDGRFGARSTDRKGICSEKTSVLEVGIGPLGS